MRVSLVSGDKRPPLHPWLGYNAVTPWEKDGGLIGCAKSPLRLSRVPLGSGGHPHSPHVPSFFFLQKLLFSASALSQDGRLLWEIAVEKKENNSPDPCSYKAGQLDGGPSWQASLLLDFISALVGGLQGAQAQKAQVSWIQHWKRHRRPN